MTSETNTWGTERQRFRRPVALPTVSLNTRFPLAVSQAMKERAMERGISQNQFIVEAVQAALAREMEGGE